MPLYIRDDEVDALAVKLQQALQTLTKTEAVRIALQHELDRQTERIPPSKRIADLLAKSREMGFAPGTSDDFDMKAFTDEMWGEND